MTESLILALFGQIGPCKSCKIIHEVSFCYLPWLTFCLQSKSKVKYESDTDTRIYAALVCLYCTAPDLDRRWAFFIALLAFT